MVTAVWKKILSDASIQRSSQTLSVVGSNAFVYGGELKPREPVDSAVHSISLNSDPSSNALATINVTNSPQPRVGAASTALNEKIYIFSGRGGIAMAPIEENGALWVFDTTNKSWSSLTPADPSAAYPAGRSYHAITSNRKDTLFVHAGCPESSRLSDLWAFNISTRQWTELPSAPGPQRGGPSITYSNGKLYRMNGFDGKTEQGGALDVFDLASNTWNTITYTADGVNGPTPRSVSCLLPVDISGRSSLVTMFGEHDPSSLGHQGAGKMLSDAWAFDVELEKWTKIAFSGEAPQPRGWFDADIHEGQAAIVVHGGLAEWNERLGDVWVLQFQ
ncbi:kelch repeat protein [Aspergillus unguis]